MSATTTVTLTPTGGAIPSELLPVIKGETGPAGAAGAAGAGATPTAGETRYASASPGAGWFEANGQALPRATYPAAAALFADDAIICTSESLGAAEDTWLPVWTGTHFVAIANGLDVYRSTTGLTGSWTKLTGALPASIGLTGQPGTDENGRIVVIERSSSNDTIVSSDHGATWAAGGNLPAFTIAGDPYQLWTAPVYIPTLGFVCLRRNGNTFAYSADGSSWTSVTIPGASTGRFWENVVSFGYTGWVEVLFFCQQEVGRCYRYASGSITNYQYSVPTFLTGEWRVPMGRRVSKTAGAAAADFLHVAYSLADFTLSAISGWTYGAFTKSYMEFLTQQMHIECLPVCMARLGNYIVCLVSAYGSADSLVAFDVTTGAFRVLRDAVPNPSYLSNPMGAGNATVAMINRGGGYLSHLHFDATMFNVPSLPIHGAQKPWIYCA